MSQAVTIPRRKPLDANVGVFGVGHHTYWGQFDGLLEEMHRKIDHLIAKVGACGVTATNFGLVDNVPGAFELLPRLEAADLDLVFCDMVTYATSSHHFALGIGHHARAIARMAEVLGVECAVVAP